MSRERWKRFIKKTKVEYYRIGSIPCPAFGGEHVYFDERGFNHLLIKNGMPRVRSEQMRRLRLLERVPAIIASSAVFSEYRHGSGADFWSLTERNSNKSITIIIRRVGTNRYHFYSVMSKNRPESTQTP